MPAPTTTRMAASRILIIQGHADPAGQHVCHALADGDGGAATAAAREIRRLDIARARVRASAQQAADRAARPARRLTP